MNPLDVLWWSLAFAGAVVFAAAAAAVGLILIGTAIYTVRGGGKHSKEPIE